MSHERSRVALCGGLDPMEGVVEHRADDLGHAGIHHDEQAIAALLFDVDHARQQRAGGCDDVATRLENDLQA